MLINLIPSHIDSHFTYIQMNILLNGDILEEMTTIVHVSKARERGKAICARLKDTIPRHQFLVCFINIAN